LRDLVIVASVPDAASSGLIDVAADQAERLAVQAAGIGAGELTRAAEVIAEGLVAMRGTTAPRLHLELMCARVLLPGADVDGRGIHARLDRLERRLGMPDSGPVVDAPAAPWGRDEQRSAAVPAEKPVALATGKPAAVPTEKPAPPEAVRKGRRTFDEPPPEDDWAPPSDRDQALPPDAAPSRPALRVVRDEPSPAPVPPASSKPAPVESVPAPVTPVEPAPSAVPAASAGAGTSKQGPAATDVRRLWPEVLEEVKRRRRFTWMTISQHAQVTEVSDGTLVLMFANPGARDSFLRGGSDDVLRDALVEVMGADLTISAVLESEGRGGPATVAPVAAATEADSPNSAEELEPASRKRRRTSGARSLMRWPRLRTQTCSPARAPRWRRPLTRRATWVSATTLM